MDGEHLFVYGTLRKGGHRQMHDVLARASVYVGPGRLHGQLFSVGRYPGAVPSSGAVEFVVGEVYRLADRDALARLDEYEGTGGPDPLFRRERAEILLDGGGSLIAWTYFYNRPTGHLRRIMSGDFFGAG